MKFAASDEHSRQFLNMPEEALQMVLSQVTDQNLRHTLQFGIGLHHAGLNDKDRSLVEELFANNKIQAELLSLEYSIISFLVEKKKNKLSLLTLMLYISNFRYWFVPAHWHGV